jgi:hypothetical protein
MIDWFRHKHGLSTDAKLAFAAKRAGVHRAFSVMLWCYCLELASAADDRGSLAELDAEEAAFSLDMKPEQVTKLLALFQGKLIADHRVIAWDKHHPASSTSTERVRMFRDRQAQRSDRSHETPPAGHEAEEGNGQKPKGNVPETFGNDDETFHLSTRAQDLDLDLESELDGGEKPAPKKARTGKRCPKLDDLVLDDELLELAHRERRDGPRELEKFKTYCRAKDIKYKDYRQGYRNWLMSDFGRSQSRGSGGKPVDMARFAEAKLRREAERLVSEAGLNIHTEEGVRAVASRIAEIRHVG